MQDEDIEGEELTCIFAKQCLCGPERGLTEIIRMIISYKVCRIDFDRLCRRQPSCVINGARDYSAAELAVAPTCDTAAEGADDDVARDFIDTLECRGTT